MEKRQKKIVVSVDFTPSSDAAIAVAHKFAAMHGAEMVLVHAIEHGFAESIADPAHLEKKREYGAKMLDKLVEQYNTPEVPVTRLLMDGKPYKEILKAADEINAEMIVMGTWGSHAIETGMIGLILCHNKLPAFIEWNTLGVAVFRQQTISLPRKLRLETIRRIVESRVQHPAVSAAGVQATINFFFKQMYG